MELLLKRANDSTEKATMILEINTKHSICTVLKEIFEKDKDSREMKNCSEILYSQALMMEGYELDNPVDISLRITQLLFSVYSRYSNINVEIRKKLKFIKWKQQNHW